jgi:hypothetical protein
LVIARSDLKISSISARLAGVARLDTFEAERSFSISLTIF